MATRKIFFSVLKWVSLVGMKERADRRGGISRQRIGDRLIICLDMPPTDSVTRSGKILQFWQNFKTILAIS